MVDLGSTIIHKMYIDFAFIQKSGKSFSVEVWNSKIYWESVTSEKIESRLPLLMQ